MLTITSLERRALRAKAHHLHPVVAIGQHGLTPSVIREIDVSLRAHELIKVRALSDIRGERDAMLGQICAKLGAAPVQHIGKLLILWRPAPEEPAAKEKPARGERPSAAKRGGKTGTGRESGKAGKTMAKSTPQARRPRSPTARAPARPPSAGTASKRRGGPPGIPSAPVSRERRRRRTP